VLPFVIASIIAGARNLLTDRFFRIVNGLCGVALIGFAVLLLYDTVVSSGA
jgi:threonine/homoserine/homoserine lactone efflux protein